MNNANGFSMGLKLLHWIMAAIIISMLFLGVSMIQSLEIWQTQALQWHQSFGALVLILVIIRLITRLFAQTPALPTDLPAWQVFMAKTSHVLLYAAMFAMPILGWLMQNANGLTVTPFGLINLPQLIEPSLPLYGLFRTLHGLVAWSFFGLIVLHIAAALYHGLVRKDGVLQQMLFRLSKERHKSKS